LPGVEHRIAREASSRNGSIPTNLRAVSRDFVPSKKLTNVEPGRVVHSIIPLSVLEMMRRQDIPAVDELDEYHVELKSRRLGMSHTVAREIDRYRQLARRDQRVTRAEAIALLQLAGRRRDAALLFAEAGRVAADLAAQQVSAVARGTWHSLPRIGRLRMGRVLAKRLLKGIFDVEFVELGSDMVVSTRDSVLIEATPQGSACALVGSATATLLRAFMDFEGAVQHEKCQALGESECQWRTSSPEGNDG